MDLLNLGEWLGFSKKLKGFDHAFKAFLIEGDMFSDLNSSKP
jgi:hypothetical protein